MSEFLIERVCPVCSTKFTVHRSRAKHGRGVHCSRECQYTANREKQSKPKIAIKCEGCGDEFERWPSHASKARFCTRECRDKHWRGELTPNWQDGSGVYKRGSNWHSIRRLVVARDGFECQECGPNEELHVHHVIPFRMFADADEANLESNLITLCAPCHRIEDAKHKWANTGEAIVRMSAGGYAWSLARAMAANDNIGMREAG